MQENNEIKYLKLEDIIPNRLQPRTEFDEEKLNELATSIKQYGIINPLLVRQVGNKYEIIAGERRYKAAKIVGLTKVPVIINNMDDSMSAEVAVIENIQRQDLSALEEARSYRKLLDQGNITQEQLAQKMGKSQSTIANKMRLLNLCEEVQEALENNQISERHARSLLQLKNINNQREILERIINERLTVKATDNLIKEKLESIPLESNKNVIENNISLPSIDNEEKDNSIYGNDIVNIAELNKKEIEKDNDNMNNNEQSIQMNQGVPVTPNQPIQMPEDQMNAATFGNRFFPSLEDQEVNVNLSNPFEVTKEVQTPNSQPMMENLVDNTPLNANIPSFVTNDMPLPNLINDMPMQQNDVNLPPLETQAPVIPEPVNQIPQNDFIPNTPVPTSIENTPTNNIVAEPIINPMMNQTPPVAPTIPQSPLPEQPSIPTVDQFAQPNIVPPIAPPISEPSIPNVAPPESQPTGPLSQAVSEPTPLEPIPTPAVAEPVVQKNTDNIINAINAIKNLGLSIESIGYKLTINEEDTPNNYKITIELEK